MSYPVTGEEGIATQLKDSSEVQHQEHGSDKEVLGTMIDDVTKDVLKHTLYEVPPLVLAMSHEQRLAAETSLRRKIDLRMLPMVVLIYIMNYLDRNNIAAARLAGLESDLHLVGTQYQTCVSILFVGYLLMQVPSNLFLSAFQKPALYLPSCMIVWGVISTATAACQSFGGLLACRFMLGFIEAAYFPGCLYYLSCWYTRKELGLRTAILYSGSQISGAFSGLIAAAITGNMDGLHGLRAWRWMFILEGTVTIGIAISALFILPNFPRTTKWLTEEERQIAVWRMEEDVGQDDLVREGDTFMTGFKLAFTDLKTYVLMVMLFCIVAAAGFGNFFPSVVATLGFNSVTSLLLTVPPYLLAVIAILFNCWSADRTGERFLHVAIPLSIAIAGFIIAVCTTTTGPRYFAMLIMAPGITAALVVVFTWVSNTLPRPPAKRAAALAGINAVSNCSSIFTSYLYPSSGSVGGPRYILAFAFNSGACFIAICTALVLRTMLVRLNKKLDVEASSMERTDTVMKAGNDITNDEQKSFRYLY